MTRETRRLTVDVEYEPGQDPAEVHAALIDALSTVAYVSNDLGFVIPSVIAQQQARPVPAPHPSTMAGRHIVPTEPT